MRVFQAAGVAVELEADMLVDTPVQGVREDGSVLSQLQRTDKPYGWAVSNFFYQPSLETKLEKLLERYPNVTALRGREVVGFSHDDTGVAIEHAASSGTRYGQANATAEAPVGYGCDPRAWLSALGARFVALYPFDGRPQGGAVKRGPAADALIEVEDLGGEGIAWFRGAGARKGRVALVRPAKFVYALTPAAHFAAAVNRVLEVYGDAPPNPAPSSGPRRGGRKGRTGGLTALFFELQVGLKRVRSDGLEDLSRVDDPVALHAEIDRAVGRGDAGLDHVAALQVLLPVGLNLHEHLPLGRFRQQRRDPLATGRRDAEGAPGRRARREKVADVKVLDARKFGERLGRPEDEVGDAVLLADFAVDRQRELKITQPAKVVRGQQAEVRANGTEGAEALALVELHLRDLHVARRVVVDDYGAGDELVQTPVRHTLGGSHVALEHETELDLVVEEAHARRPHDIGVGGRDAA